HRHRGLAPEYEVIAGDDVRVVEPARDERLAAEPLAIFHRGRQAGAQHLQRDSPALETVPPQKHAAHTALAQLAYEIVPVSQRFLEPGTLVRESSSFEQREPWCRHNRPLKDFASLC